MVNCVKGINIEAISCAVPARKLSIQEYAPDLLTEKSAKRMAKGTGFSSLRISDDDTTTNSADASTARTLAEEMVSRLEDGEDFEDLCHEYATDDAKANYESEDTEYSLTEGMTCSSTNISYSDWLSDESRKAGDITIIEDSTTGTCYVLKFVSRTYDESCPDTISSTLSTEAVNEYLDTLLEGKYEAVDLKGEISYLTSSEEESDSEDTSDTESLLDTSIIE